MADPRRVFALFRVAAGPRLGYGHLRRATVLAETLGQSCALSVRGAAVTSGPWRMAPSTPTAAIEDVRPSLLVIDDPRADRARPWLRAARRAGVPCASLHDIGLAAVASDLAIDGSLIRRGTWPARAVLDGPAHAVLGLRGLRPRRRVVTARALRILVSLGGGAHGARVRAIVEAVQTALPEARIVVPEGRPGVTGLHAVVGHPVEIVPAANGLGPVLASADLAILGGGVSLYEAAALGVPVVCVAVVRAQQPTVRAFVRAGLAVTIPSTPTLSVLARQVARCTRALALDVARRRHMRDRGPTLIDGRGAWRVARALRALAVSHA